MKNEIHIVNLLKEESEILDREEDSSKSKLRFCQPSYDLSGWNEEFLNWKTRDSKEIKIPRFKHHSEYQSVENLIFKNNSPSEHKIHRRRSTYVMKKSITPVVYNVHKALVDHCNLPSAIRLLHPIEKPLKIMNKRKSNFLKKRSSVYKPAKKDLSVIECLLKPEVRNPVTSAIVPRLKSRSEQHRVSSKRKVKKRINFACLEFNLADPLHISAKSFNPN
jgi:hypothetical protein